MIQLVKCPSALKSFLNRIKLYAYNAQCDKSKNSQWCFFFFFCFSFCHQICQNILNFHFFKSKIWGWCSRLVPLPVAPVCHMGTVHSWLLLLPIEILAVVWESSGGWPYALGPCCHVGGLGGAHALVLSAQLWLLQLFMEWTSGQKICHSVSNSDF